MNQELATMPVPSHLYDGYQVHRAALARGLNVLALPRQVLLAGGSPVVPAAISFTHGVPEASTVSAVTFAQDRRLRRALVERAGLPVPKGATFSFRGTKRAGEWAKQIGFPVVVKETVGENPARSVTDVTSPDELVAAFKALRLRDPADRSPGSNPMIAGYAATRLGFELDDEGNQVATARTRFLVEKQPVGEHVRVFACSGQPVQAVLLDPATGQGIRDVGSDLEPSLHEIALKAVTSVSGLAVGSIDIVVDDHTKSAADQNVSIVEVSERIRSETYDSAADGVGDQIGDALVEFQASVANLDLAEPIADVSVTMRVEGLRDASAAVAGFADVAGTHGVAGKASVADQLEGLVDASCQGPPSAVAALTEALMGGLVLDDRASCIETRHDA